MKQLLSSKKFWVTLLGVVGAALSEAGDQPTGVSIAIGLGTAVFVIAQGLADQGKEAAKVHLEASLKGVELAKSKMPAGTYWNGARYVEPGDPDWSLKALEKVVEVPK